MSYVDKHLMVGEQVAYRTRRHGIIFARPIFVFVLGLAVFIGLRLWGPTEAPTGASVVLLVSAVLAGLMAIPAAIDRHCSEFAVTDKRVIVKIGWLQRRSLETLLSKVEAIEVNQGILGRLLDYGSIVIIGTGGTREPFDRIAQPLVFRRKVQEQILAFQGNMPPAATKNVQ